MTRLYVSCKFYGHIWRQCPTETWTCLSLQQTTVRSLLDFDTFGHKFATARLVFVTFLFSQDPCFLNHRARERAAGGRMITTARALFTLTSLAGWTLRHRPDWGSDSDLTYCNKTGPDFCPNISREKRARSTF